MSTQSGTRTRRNRLEDVARSAGVSKSIASRVLNGDPDLARAAGDAGARRPGRPAAPLPPPRRSTRAQAGADRHPRPARPAAYEPGLHAHHPWGGRACARAGLRRAAGGGRRPGRGGGGRRTPRPGRPDRRPHRRLGPPGPSAAPLLSAAWASRTCSSTAACQGAAATSSWTTPARAFSRVDHLVSLGHQPRRARSRAARAGHGPAARHGVSRARAPALGLHAGSPRATSARAAAPRPGERCSSAIRSLTALYASTISQAVGVFHAAWERDLRVPGDLSVIAYDDIPLADFLRPPLTTVRMPLAELGAAAVDALLDQLLGGEPRDVTVGTAPRSSSAARLPHMSVARFQLAPDMRGTSRFPHTPSPAHRPRSAHERDRRGRGDSAARPRQPG